jgi:uncharacterized surface anchored protein
MACTVMNKFRSILKETNDKNLSEEEVSKDDEELTKEQRIEVKKNKVTMASFTIAFTTYKWMNMVFAAATEEWQEGEAYLVVKELMKKYRPHDNFQRLIWEKN